MTGSATKLPMPAAMPIEAMAERRFSGGASRPMVPTSEVTPVPLTPMPISRPLITRSVADVAAYIQYRPAIAASTQMAMTRPAP